MKGVLDSAAEHDFKKEHVQDCGSRSSTSTIGTRPQTLSQRPPST